MTYFAPFDADWNIEKAADEAAYLSMREEFGHLTLWSLLKYMTDDEDDCVENPTNALAEIAYKSSRIPINFENPTLSV